MKAAAEEKNPLYSSLGGDADFAPLLAWFVEELPSRIATFEEQLAAGDWDGLRQAAHQLKGAGGSYGFAPITPAAGRLEAAVVQREPEEEIRAAVEALVDLCRRACAGQPD